MFSSWIAINTFLQAIWYTAMCFWSYITNPPEFTHSFLFILQGPSWTSGQQRVTWTSRHSRSNSKIKTQYWSHFISSYESDLCLSTEVIRQSLQLQLRASSHALFLYALFILVSCSLQFALTFQKAKCFSSLHRPISALKCQSTVQFDKSCFSYASCSYR